MGLQERRHRQAPGTGADRREPPLHVVVARARPSGRRGGALLGLGDVVERVARRVRARLIGDQAELFPDWRHFAFVTNRSEPLALVESEHRQHAVVELAIRDLKDQALAHFPSGKLNANAAWTVIACLAHNLLRWTT
jgi:hypothetical protein